MVGRFKAEQAKFLIFTGFFSIVREALRLILPDRWRLRQPMLNLKILKTADFPLMFLLRKCEVFYFKNKILLERFLLIFQDPKNFASSYRLSFHLDFLNRKITLQNTAGKFPSTINIKRKAFYIPGWIVHKKSIKLKVP